MTFNILYTDNGVGQSRDAIILAKLLPVNSKIYFTDLSKNIAPQKADVSIFMEHVRPQYFVYAKRNYLIPNPEWYFEENTKYIGNFTAILCKTKHAVTVFGKYHKDVRFISFASFDRKMILERKRIFLHTQGKSETKGTELLLQAWRPEFPKLFITTSKPLPAIPNENIIIHRQRLSDDDFKLLQNMCMFHACPSKYEGWGHYIDEARSTGAIVLTTNYPPMNELITQEYGFLANIDKTSKMGIVQIGHPSVKEIQKNVELMMCMREGEIGERMNATREAYEDNREYFEKTIKSMSW